MGTTPARNGSRAKAAPSSPWCAKYMVPAHGTRPACNRPGHTVAGQTTVATVDGYKYALKVYKQPKTGGNPPKLVPIMLNVWYAAPGPIHHTSREIHPLIACTGKWHAGGLRQPDGVGDVPPMEADDLVASRARLSLEVCRGQCVRHLPRPRAKSWHGQHAEVAVVAPAAALL